MLYLNTIKYLRPTQLFYQLKYRLFKIKINESQGPKTINNVRLYMKELDSGKEYLSRFSSEKLLNNKLLILNSEFDIDLTKWENSDATRLWNFNLHYLEFLIMLANDFNNTGNRRYYEKFKEILNSWIDVNNNYTGDGWKSYTISLRIINILISIDLLGHIFNKDRNFKIKVYSSLYRQYRFLLSNQEKHLLGNHYFENLNTIVICSILFNDNNTYNIYIKRYLNQIEEQILNDGVHFERSIMYHKIILERIIRTYNLLKDYDDTYNTYFEGVINRMTNALVSLEKGMGKTPHFNDSANGISKNTKSLMSAVKQVINYKESYNNDFQSSGYYKLYSGNMALMFDIGKIGPSYMPGHGHCDALSFEISKDERPIFVNSGTYNYQTPLRDFFRRTEAHNTFMIGDTQQSQVWGEHRVAKRISKIKCKTKNNEIIGSFSNYKGERQERKILIKDENKILIRDRVKTSYNQSVRSFLHLAPGLSIQRQDKGIFLVTNRKDNLVCRISSYNIENSKIHKEGILTNYSEEFGHLDKKNAIELIWNSSSNYNEIKIEFIMN